jgi:hypothetical protein
VDPNECNPWTISIAALQQHAERQAKRVRLCASILGILTILAAGFVAWFSLSSRAYEHVRLEWAIARLSTLVLLVAALLLSSRIVWNFSNVWLGRAGTLEDLVLALRLIGKRPADSELPNRQAVARLLSEPLSKEAAERLQTVVGSMERLRRSFEGELLKGPPSELTSGKLPLSSE